MKKLLLLPLLFSWCMAIGQVTFKTLSSREYYLNCKTFVSIPPKAIECDTVWLPVKKDSIKFDSLLKSGTLTDPGIAKNPYSSSLLTAINQSKPDTIPGAISWITMINGVVKQVWVHGYRVSKPHTFEEIYLYDDKSLIHLRVFLFAPDKFVNNFNQKP